MHVKCFIFCLLQLLIYIDIDTVFEVPKHLVSKTSVPVPTPVPVPVPVPKFPGNLGCDAFTFHCIYYYVYDLLLHCSYVINVVDAFVCNYDYEKF